MAIALALPLHLPGRDLIIVVTFSVIMVTVLVQGTTLERLLSAGGLGASSASEEERAGAVSVRVRVAQVSIDCLRSQQGSDGEMPHPQLTPSLSRTRREPARG